MKIWDPACVSGKCVDGFRGKAKVHKPLCLVKRGLGIGLIRRAMDPTHEGLSLCRSS